MCITAKSSPIKIGLKYIMDVISKVRVNTRVFSYRGELINRLIRLKIVCGVYFQVSTYSQGSRLDVGIGLKRFYVRSFCIFGVSKFLKINFQTLEKP